MSKIISDEDNDCYGPPAEEGAAMSWTASESADLKMALKHDPVTDDLRAEAERHPVEADEAYFEALDGRDTYGEDSWVAELLTARGADPA